MDLEAELGLQIWGVRGGRRPLHAADRDRAEALGLELAIGPGGEWPVECDLSADEPSHRELGLAWHKQQVDLAGAQAVAYAGALRAPRRVVQRVPRADECAHGRAAPRWPSGLPSTGVAIVLEPMSHFRTHLANTPAQVLQLMDLADHPNLRILVDTYHIVTEVRFRQPSVPAATGCGASIRARMMTGACPAAVWCRGTTSSPRCVTSASTAT
ncbi:MAG: TIM barrel protein [Caldilineaceae bacterium]